MAEPVYLSAFRRTRTCNVALLTSDQTLLAAATVAAAYEEAQIVRVSVAPCAHPSASSIHAPPMKVETSPVRLGLVYGVNPILNA